MENLPAGNRIFIYGPPGSGKTSLGRILAEKLGLAFNDLDELVRLRADSSIPDIFLAEGEAGFRQRESAELRTLLEHFSGVVALGGGTLLDPCNRALVDHQGVVLCLAAPLETLLARLNSDPNPRPLVSNQSLLPIHELPIPNPGAISNQKLSTLLAGRADHYASFTDQLDVSQSGLEDLAWQAQVRLGMFRVQGMGAGYDVRVAIGGLECLGELIQARDLGRQAVLVCDSNVAGTYSERALTALHGVGITADLVVIPAGEEFKTIQTVQSLWAGFLNAGLDRSSTVVALGGGVIGDLTGFAAATYLRGVRWVGVPTTLLSMIDASLGGKTGADLPQGKNLVGAFHPPALVLADPTVLRSLPETELRSGFGEVVKHGVIGDPQLFAVCAQGWDGVLERMDEVVRRAMAVKIKVIQMDPYEQGQRAALNLGHTLGHALELVSNYTIRHGEAVAIGMAAAARLSGRLGLAEPGLAERIQTVLSGLGLPVAIPPGLDRTSLLTAMGVDKKRKAGKVRLALPVRIGEVQVGITIDHLEDLLNA
jgi:shikimate kinase / 3-dehydroquinate synthase